MKSKVQLFGLLLLALLVLGTFGNSMLQATEPAKTQQQPQQLVVVPQEQAVINAVKTVGPAVVSIVVKDVVRGYDFFLQPYEEQMEGIGSGFIFDKRGYVLTNNHVIQGADEIKVILTDKREFTGEVLGADPQNDLAVVKLDNAENLPVVTLGDSDKLQVGQMTIAIGTPYDLNFQNTVTTGVVSALGRAIQSQSQSRTGSAVSMSNLIQTDASINPGNSGGPLLDSQGKVIGINTAILGNAQGMGFAIPINTAKSIINDLIEYGYAKRPYIGIYGQAISAQTLDAYFGYKADGGVYIAQVVAGSPADKAGVKTGDIVLEVDKQKVKDMEQLKQIIQNKGIGKDIQLLVLTKKGVEVVSVKIGESPAPTKEDTSKSDQKSKKTNK